MSLSVAVYDASSIEHAQEIAKQRKAEAKLHFEAICKAGKLESISSMRIGFHAAILKRDSLFGILGFESEDEARKASGVGKSTWYSTIRIAEAFHGLEEEQFVEMKLGNAHAACDIPESKRLSREWIRMATTMKIEDFQAKVDELMDGKAKPSDGKEKSVVLKMPMPKSRKESFEHHIKICAEQFGVNPDDQGKVVELLAVERAEQPGLITAITNAVQLIKAAKELKASNMSAEEVLEKIYGILDEIALGFDESLTAVQFLEKQA